MIAAVSPADYNYEETLSTLRYAARAKSIKNKPKINEDPKDALLKQYEDEIKKLKAMLEQANSGAKSQSHVTNEIKNFQRALSNDGNILNVPQQKEETVDELIAKL